MRETEMTKFNRHLGALMRKNVLLKQRSPCSTCCELFLAIGAVGLLVLVRALASDVKSLEVPAEHHVDRTMPVRLPECAEYLPECSVDLVEEKNHSLMCVKGVTFGCSAPHSGRYGRSGAAATGGFGSGAGVWASSGCHGVFRTGDDGAKEIRCSSGQLGRMRVCTGREDWDGEEEETDDGSDRLGRGAQGNPPDMLAGMLSGEGQQSSMRRLSARFGVASPDAEGARLFQRWLALRGHPWADNAHVFESAEALQSHVDSPDYPERDMMANRSAYLCGAVVFETSPRLPEVRYTLRLNRSLPYDPNLPPLASMMMATKIKSESLTKKKKGSGPPKFSPAGITWYTQSGFLSMQRTVDTFLEDLQLHGPAAILRADVAPFGGGGGLAAGGLVGEDGRPHLVVPFPTPEWKRDIFATLMPQLLALFLMVSLAYSVNRMITSVVHEREARLRDGMRMMGMHTAAFYASWILTYLAIYAFVCLGVVLCLSCGGILPNSSPSLLLVWMMLFACASISYALLITVFFQRAKTAATVGSIVFYASSNLVDLVEVNSSASFMRLISLFPPVCFELAANIFADVESQGSGITWQNAGNRIDSQRFSVLDGCGMLALDAVVLLAAFVYLDMVIPRDTGLQLPWYFPLQRTFWHELLGARSAGTLQDAARDGASQDPEVPESSALVERDIGEAAAVMERSGQVVKLEALSKSFGEIRAVQELSLVMYQGEIFALLGHNGAGKTTTLGMLCGLMPPSRGTCEVFGHCLASEPAQVQKLLGVCPQHDVLWDELTCEEHLALFAGFKGVPASEVAAEVSEILKRVGLHAAGADRRRAGRLSGGMKRKLSLGIAFLGGSRLVVLDEPTSGLDPYSRRLVWELLRAMKHGRVTILSTHYMDEADILGDRIAILHEGRLRCCGSPQFLKRAYDCGYNITLVKQPGCDAEDVRESLCRHVPELASEVVTLSNSGNELIFQFPFAAARHFATVLGSLEQQLHELRIESYGVSITTLEEVFLKVASGEPVERQAGQADASGSESDGRCTEYVELQDLPGAARQVRVHGDQTASPSRLRIWGSPAGSHAEHGGEAAGGGESATAGLATRQLAAMVRKRWTHGLRDRRGLLCQLFLPSAALLLLLGILSRHLFRSQPALELDVGGYNEGCLGTPQNLVDFTHLASIPEGEARRVLEPGTGFWRGDLRGFEPAPGDEETAATEKLLLSTLPNLFGNAVLPSIQRVLVKGDAGGGDAGGGGEAMLPLLQQLLAGAGGRRLGAAGAGSGGAPRPGAAGDGIQGNTTALMEDLVKAFLAELILEWWALGSRTWHGAESAVEEALPWMAWSAPLAEALPTHLAGRRLKAFPLMRRSVGVEQQPSGYGPRAGGSERWVASGEAASAGGTGDDWHSFIPACMDASTAELALWRQLDADRDDVVGAKDLKTFFRRLTSKAGARLGGDEGIDEEQRRELEEGLPGRLAEAVLVGFNGDPDGAISMSEFCSAGGRVRQEVGHVYQLAERFSEQILSSPSQCSRYGAYYVVQAPRRDGSPKWAAGADAVMFVNTSSMHAAPAFQAALTNARFSRLGLNKRVSVSIHPFPQTKDEQKNLEQFASFFLSVYITLCLSFIPAGIVHSVVKERVSGARQLQVLSGASHLAYWAANLVYDLAMYAVPAVCIPWSLRAFGFRMMLKGDCGMAVYAVLVAFGPAVAGFSYVASFFFRDHSKASNSILSFCLIGGMVFSTIIFILTILNYSPSSAHPSGCDIPTDEFPEGNCAFPRAQLAKRILSPFFRMVPTVCACHALFCIALLASLKEIVPQGSVDAMAALTGGTGSHFSMSPFAWEWAGEPLLYLAIEAVAYCVAAVLVDTYIHSPRCIRLVDAASWFHRLASWRGVRDGARGIANGAPLIDGGAATLESIGDESVETERVQTDMMEPENLALRMWKLEKTYRHWLEWRGAPKRAVRGVSLALRPGEVFGLLGHNGAGKTSALKCLIGELCCTGGSVHVGGFDMESDTSKARQKIGYCPQFDALLELLTVRDHLKLFGALKGVPAEVVKLAPQQFKLEKMLDRRADLLSGGNKRKLSAAISLLGGPALSVLDEPSCGLDPAARRALWAAIHSVVSGTPGLPTTRGVVAPTCVLLTTHSMEEAEALSSRLGILADGLLLTVGTPQQIKQRRGRSHELCFTLRPESASALATTMEQLGGTALQPHTRLSYLSVGPLLDAVPAKRRAYDGARCVVRAQMEAFGWVEASVLSEWWVQQCRGEAIHGFLRELVGEGVELAENFGLHWRFCLPHSSVGLPELFGQLETRGKELGIAEYTLTQATLEQIFNSIAQGAEDQRALAT